jgi:VIT1/CCC1 family predicted Fe2+/Mn2+ transporter
MLDARSQGSQEYKLNPSNVTSAGSNKRNLEHNPRRMSGLSDPELDIMPSDMMLSPNNGVRRTMMERTFSKVGKGSLRGSIFSLCACAIGSGVLSLPYVLALCGWALGIAFIFIGAVAAVWSNTILAELAVKEGLSNLS